MEKLRVTSVTITLSKTIQVVNFEPIRVDVTQTAEVGPDDNASQVRRALYENTSKALNTMMKFEIEKWRNS